MASGKPGAVHLAMRRPDPAVVRWLKAGTGRLALPMGSIIEIERGIQFLRTDGSPKADELEDWLDSLLESDLVVLPVDIEIARLYARMTTVPILQNLWLQKAQKRRSKHPQDLQVAATAIVHCGIVATLDITDFLLISRYFPLPGLINPASGAWPVSPRLPDWEAITDTETHAVERTPF